jgi:multiple sugar transport system substrate-binding protein
MGNHVRLGVLVFGAATAMVVPAMAADLTVTCRCVIGGVNGQEAEWITKDVIPDFMAAHSGVNVTLKQFAGEDAALAQQEALDFSTSAGADVAGFDGFLIPSFVDGGLLKPLDEVAGKDVDSWEGWSHISDGAKSIMSYQGKAYGLALGTDVRMIFTRKDLLKKAGLPEDWQPKSWQDLLDAARALKKADPKSFPLQLDAGVNMGEATTMQGYYMALLGTGESVRDDSGKWIVSSPGILDTLKLYKTIYVDEKLGDQRAQLLADGRNQTFANFRDGKTALLVEGDWFYRAVTAPGSEFAVADRDKVMGWAKMPAEQPGKGLRGQDFVTISGGTGFVLNPHTKDPANAWALLSFMNSKEELDKLQTHQPGIRIRDDVPVANSPFLTQTSATLLPLTTARPNDANYNKVSAAIQQMTESVVSGESSPEDAMAAFKATVTGIVGADNTVSKS